MSAHVLVVDDIAANVKILEAKLTANYYAVSTAMSGQECIDVARRERPDLILLDVMMPGMNGIDTCLRMREKHPSQELPIIFCSARDRVEDVVGGLEAEANDYLIKPISRSELLLRVKSHLNLLYINRNLEKLVKERTGILEQQTLELNTLNETLDTQNKQLDDRNRELSALVNIIKSINQKSDLNGLLNDLLNQSKMLFPNTERAVYLSLEGRSFHVASKMGFESGRFDDLALNETELISAFKKGSLVLDKGVYLLRKKGVAAIANFLNLKNAPLSMLVMALNLDSRLVGVLLLMHEEKNAYQQSDIGKLERFRQHVVSAVAKVRLINELEIKTTQVLRGLRYTQSHMALEPVKERMKRVLRDQFVLYKPKDQVSGDFVWFQETNDAIYIAIGDSPDQWGAGAFLSMVGFQLLEHIVEKEDLENPSAILSRMEIILQKTMARDSAIQLNELGMGISLCRIDLENCRVLFSGGSRALYFTQNKQIQRIEGDPVMLGLGHSTHEFRDHELLLQRGDRLYLTSAGIFEQRNDSQTRFGEERYLSLLNSLPENKFWRHGDMIWDAVGLFRGSEGRGKDISVVGLQLDPNG